MSGSEADFGPMLRFLHTLGLGPRQNGCPPGETLSISDVPEKVLEILVSSRNRKGSLERMGFESCRSGMLATLRRCIDQEKPVELTLMAFPFKVPNPAKVGERRLPDLAELAALCRLGELNDEIRKVYRPGLLLHLIHDGSYISEIFGVSPSEVREYEVYMRGMIQIMGLGSTVRTHDFFTLLHENREDVEAAVDLIGAEAVAWLQSSRSTDEWVGCFNSTLGMIDLRALSPVVASQVMRWAVEGRLPQPYRDLEKRTLEAMLRYRIRDVLLHRCDPRPRAFPDAIHVTTNNRPGRLAIWLVRRGRSLLPWHGVGVVDAGGQLSVLPYRDVRSNPGFRPLWFTGETAPFGFTAMPADVLRQPALLEVSA
jgi:hypothetical protein